MLVRAKRFAFLASIAAAVPFFVMPSPSIGLPATNVVRLYTLQPVGFGGRLAVIGSSIGKVLRTADGGQVFGFDVDHNGTDGILASAETISPQGQVLASVETFDQSTVKITKVIVTTKTMDDFVAFGIFTGDVGLVEHEHVVNNVVHRTWHLLNPVTGEMFTGKWTPPNESNFLMNQIVDNQATSIAAVLGMDFSGNPLLFSSNVPANTFGPVFHLDGNIFGGADAPQLSEDTVHNLAVIATSPDAGRVGGSVPLIATVNLATGRTREFNGVLIPPFNSGYVNGLAVDSATGIACTSTELDANVEFYKIKDATGFNVPLPGANNNQFNSGEAVVNDPIHKLFLVVQPNGTVGPSGDSVIDVFNERGGLVKSITGFKAWSVTPGIAINPTTRSGFIQGPTDDALTQFTY